MINIKIKTKRLDGLLSIFLFVEANIEAHIQLFHLQDRSALSAEQLCYL